MLENEEHSGETVQRTAFTRSPRPRSRSLPLFFFLAPRRDYLDGEQSHKRDPGVPRTASLTSLTNPEPVFLTQPHGRSWKVLDRRRFIEEVVPQYYVCKKFESFTRQ